MRPPRIQHEGNVPQDMSSMHLASQMQRLDAVSWSALSAVLRPAHSTSAWRRSRSLERRQRHRSRSAERQRRRHSRSPGRGRRRRSPSPARNKPAPLLEHPEKYGVYRGRVRGFMRDGVFVELQVGLFTDSQESLGHGTCVHPYTKQHLLTLYVFHEILLSFTSHVAHVLADSQLALL